MTHAITLPVGLRHRSLDLADARRVYELLAAQDQHDLGQVVIEEADIASDWQRPSFDVSSRTIGVFDADLLVGYAELSGLDRGEAAVLPSHRGRGIGTALAGWMRAHARSLGSSVIGVPVPVGSAGDRLLAALGYGVRWTSWELELPEGARIPARDLPPGHTVREATSDDLQTCWTVLEDAFLEWSVRDREPFDDFLARVVHRPGFEPWNLRVVTDGAGVIVGVAFVHPAGTHATIGRIATRKDQRGRGLGQALLVDAFETARQHGCTRSILNTDSRTGALGLYEKVGMRVYRTWVNRCVSL